MNTELLRGMIGSIVRWIIPLIIGWVGIEVGEEEIGKIATALTVVGVFVVSILWSLAAKNKALRAPPPKS